MFKFDDDFFARRRMDNVDREWLMKDLETAGNDIVAQLATILREGTRENIRMAKDFIQGTLDGVRRLDLTVQINNDKNLSSQEKEALLDKFIYR
jgi:hypothetical protein